MTEDSPDNLKNERRLTSKYSYLSNYDFKKNWLLLMYLIVIMFI